MAEILLNWGSIHCLMTKPTVFLSTPKHVEFFIKVTFNIVIYALRYKKKAVFEKNFFIFMKLIY